jgi:putative transposase
LERFHTGKRCVSFFGLAEQWYPVFSLNLFTLWNVISGVHPPKGVEYPYFTKALDINNIHQADLVGPRYIKGDAKFYSFNVMDIYSHQVYIESQRTKQDRQVGASLMRCWETMGLPDFLQLDNELSFRGSNRHPRSPGLVIRLCLHFAVTPVFIPIGEPWRNGTIEKFNDTYNKMFFRRQWFPNYATLKRQSKNFQRFHNKHHRYSFLKGKTPVQITDDHRPVTIGANTKLPKLDSVPDGNITLIRFIRSNRLLDVFGEKFKVSKDLVYSYVKVVVVTQIDTLQIYLGDDCCTPLNIS